MKFICFSLLFLTCCLYSFGQVQRAFITKDGKYSNDPKTAVAYVLIRKMDTDSAYNVQQFDMHDTIMVSGVYKDELLTIPNGRFTYYNKLRPVKDKKGRIADQFKNADTNNYIQRRGYFIDGKKEGIWIFYASRGVAALRASYENDKMNGPFTTYSTGSDGFWSEGVMVNGVQEGKNKIYNLDSLLIAESDYVHGKESNRINHLEEAAESEKFHDYLRVQLEKYKKEFEENVPVVRFTVTRMGTLKDIIIIKGINPQIDTALIAILSKAPLFTPGKYDGQIFEERITKPLLVFHDVDIDISLPPLNSMRSVPRLQQGGTNKSGSN